MQTSLPPGQEEVYQFHGHGRQDPEASPIRRVKRPNSSMGESPRAVLGNLVHNKVRQPKSCSTPHRLQLAAGITFWAVQPVTCKVQNVPGRAQITQAKEISQIIHRSTGVLLLHARRGVWFQLETGV